MASRMIQNNFSGGEISPSLYGRSDLQAYYKGCADAENFVVSKEGTLRKRHGISSFMALAKPFSRYKILPYKYDRSAGGFFLAYLTDDTWADGTTATSTTIRLQFYDKAGTLHTWTEDGETVSYRDVSGFKGSIKDIQVKQIGDEVWFCNQYIFKIAKVTNNASFTIESWQQTGVPDKILYNKTLNTASTHWYAARSSYEETDNYKKVNYGCIAVLDSVNSETTKKALDWTSTWQAGTYIDITVQVAVADLDKWDYVIIAKRTGGTYGELSRCYLAEDPDEYWYNSGSTWKQLYKWADGKYYDKTEGSSSATEYTPNYYRWTFRDENHTPTDLVYGQTNILGDEFTTPLCVDCFQQRRVFANAANSKGKLPMTLWFSEVGNLNNFYSDRPADDSDAFSPSIASSGPAFIRFIVAYQEMMVLFTDSGLFSIGFSQQTGFSSTTCRISKFSDLACSQDIQPVVTEAGIVFVGADNKTIYSVSYSLQENMLKPINRTVLTEHLTRTTPVKAIALQDYPDNVVWCVTSDGKACSFTVEKNEDVYSWSHSVITGAKILDAVSIGTCTDSTTDRTYGDLVFVVEKTTGEGDAAVTNYYLAKPNTGYADVIGGVTTNVRATVTTLRAESQERTIVGLKKNIRDVLVRLYETGGISVRSTSGTDLPLIAAKTPSGLFTGDAKVMPRGFVNEDGRLTIVSDNNQACEILQIVISMEIE